MEERVEASIRMICAFYFHKEMAENPQRAKDQQSLWVEEVGRLKRLITQEKERSRKEGYQEGQDSAIYEMDMQAQNHWLQVGREQGRNDAVNEIIAGATANASRTSFVIPHAALTFAARAPKP